MITLENGASVPISEIASYQFRSSLEPVPLTFECEIKLDEAYAAFLLEGKILKVGKEEVEVKIVHARDVVAPWHNGAEITIRHIIALHNKSSGIAQTLERAVIRENVGLSEVYRSCGGKSQVEKEFIVPRFYAYRGNVPSFLIARVCQEHGGAVRWLPDGDRLSFVRIHDLFSQTPVGVKAANSDYTVKSGFLVEHELPAYFSLDEQGAVLQAQTSGKGASVFSPQKSQAQLNAMGNVILNSKEIPCDFNPNLHAGALVRIGGIDMVVLTAAHVYRQSETGAPEEGSIFWAGVKNTGGNSAKQEE